VLLWTNQPCRCSCAADLSALRRSLARAARFRGPVRSSKTLFRKVNLRSRTRQGRYECRIHTHQNLEPEWHITRCSMSCVAYLCGHPPLHSHVLQHVTVPPTRAARTYCAGTARAARLLQIAFQALVLILQPAGGGRSALAALALPWHLVSRCCRAAVALGAREPLERHGRGPELRAHLPQREAHLRTKRAAQPATRLRPRSCGGLLDSDLFDVLRSRRLLVLVLARERHV